MVEWLPSEIWAASDARLELALTRATTAPPRLCPGSGSHLCPMIKSSPWLWPPQIQCCAVAWSEQVTETWGPLEQTCLHPASRASQHARALLMRGVEASHRPSVSLGSPPTSQRGSSPLRRTPGPVHPIGGSHHSHPRAGVCLCNLPFLLSPLPGAWILTQLLFFPSYLITCGSSYSFCCTGVLLFLVSFQ